MRAAAPLTLYDYWLIARRRAWLILGVVCLGVLSSAILCVVLPKSYRSSTLILIEDQKIPENYVKAIVGGSLEERLTMIQQQVMSRTLLSSVISELQLYGPEVRADGLDTVIEAMRKNIQVETVETRTGRVGNIEAFTISFAHENPVTAMRVTARIASHFIEENLRVREQLVEGASAFLDQELQLAKDALEEQERAISAFKTQFMGELPQQTDANLRALDRFQADLIAVNEMLHRHEARRTRLHDTIDDYLAAATANHEGATASAAHDGRDGLASRYRELERKLAALTAEYTDRYPDVIQVRKELAEVEAQLATRDENGLAINGSEASRPADAFLYGLFRERDEVEAEVGALKLRRGQLQEQIAKYEARIERVPAREKELAALLRDYENQQANYRSLLDKKLNARVAIDLEKRQKGEQFRIIDPANVPETPDKPNRVRIMLVGLAMGCGLGFGTALILERASQPFRQSQEVERGLGSHVLAVIPDFVSSGDRSWKQRGMKMVRAARRGAGQMIAARRKRGQSFEGSSHPAGWGNGGWTGPEIEHVPFVAKLCPATAVAEQYRVAATRLSLMTAGTQSKVIVATSSVKGEGKTTTVINLGYTLARDLGKRTLLIDCDFHCPALHRYALVQNEPGLADVLEGRIEAESAVFSLGDVPCWVMPLGMQHSRAIELSKTVQVEALVTRLRERFDYVLIDAPPILPLADMNVLGTLADLLLMVIRAGKTPQHVVVNALTTLKPQMQMLVVLNAMDVQTMPYYQYYDYRGRAAEPQHT